MRAKVVNYDKIRKQFKIVIHENANPTKLYLEKESFFDIGIIPKTSTIWRYLRKSNSNELLDTVNFKEHLDKETFDNLMCRGRIVHDYVKVKF